MSYLLLILSVLISFSTMAKVIEAPNHGGYQLVGVRCSVDGPLRYAETKQFKSFKPEIMVQAKIPNRSALAAYFLGMRLYPDHGKLMMAWQQLHTGNPTTDARNHTPFFSHFSTVAEVKHGNLVNMHLRERAIYILYLEKEYNGRHFTEADIKDRMLKHKHMGAYSSKVIWTSLTDDKFPDVPLIELRELSKGFGMPRHLLCGSPTAPISYVFRRL